MSSSLERARLLMQQQRYDLAEQTWRLVLSEQPDLAEGHACLALCLVEREHLDDAQGEAEQAIRLAPDNAFMHFVHARILRDRNRYPQALIAINEAIRLDPEDADYRAILASIQGVQSQWSECLKAADAGLALDATNMACANLRAMALTNLDRRDAAEATIAGALQQAPENSMTHANQGWALLHRGQASQALNHFRESLRLDPGNDWAREGLLTAIKARNPLFRVILSFFLLMSRQSATARYMVIIGIVVGRNIIREITSEHPEYGPYLIPVSIALGLFVYMTWLANPLMNLVMRLHPVGKHALTSDQRSQSILVGLALLATVIDIGIQYANGGISYLCLVPLLLSLPLASIHNMERGWPRTVAISTSIVFAIVALEVTVGSQLIQPYIRNKALDPDPLVGLLAIISGWLILPYFIGIMLWSFISQPLSRVQPVR